MFLDIFRDDFHQPTFYSRPCLFPEKWWFDSLCILDRWYGKWADLSTRHHVKVSPKGSGLMWYLAFPAMPYACSLALMLLAFTARRMVRSAHLALMLLAFTMRRMVRLAHLALSPKRLIVQIFFSPELSILIINC